MATSAAPAAPKAKDTNSLEREDLSDPTSWKMAETNLHSLEKRILAGLRAKGYPATSVEMDPSKLKGGYICDTMRVFIGYGQDETHTKGARAEAESRASGGRGEGELPKSVLSRPPTAILKIASPLSNDHDVAMRLRLYEREWHFYETLSSRVPVRVPVHLGSVKDEATGLLTEGVLLEDLEIPGAVLCPKLDDNGVLRTVSSMARHHAQFWNMPELSSGALGIKPHNSPVSTLPSPSLLLSPLTCFARPLHLLPRATRRRSSRPRARVRTLPAQWYQPGWGDDILGYWPRFESKWRSRMGGDAMGPGMPHAAARAHGHSVLRAEPLA